MNSIIEAYLPTFFNYEQNDGVKLLPIDGFVYKNTKNVNIGHISFELNCNFEKYNQLC